MAAVLSAAGAVVAQAWADHGGRDGLWPGRYVGTLGLWWFELACLVATLLLVAVLAGFWRERQPGPVAGGGDHRRAAPPARPEPEGRRRAPAPPIGPSSPAAPAGPGSPRTERPAGRGAAGPTPRPVVLASDAERDEAARTVSWAVGEGCLELDEATTRVDAVLRARHRHELAALVADLPGPPVLRRAGHGRRAVVAAAAVATLAAAAVQAVAGVWELWPLALVAVGAWGARDARRR